MTHHPLLLLTKLRLVGQWRVTKRSLATPTGLVMGLFMLGFLSTLVLPRLVVPGVPDEVRMPIAKWIFHPGILLVMWLSSLVGSRLKSPIAFTMAEVDFLFPGPFTRRRLLVHKLLLSSLGPLGLAVMAPLVIPFVYPPAGAIGALLVATFVQWWTILLALALDWIGARYRLLRWTVLLVALAAAAVSIWHSGALDPAGDWRARLAALESSWAARIVLAPFVVFSRVLGASTLAQVAAWSAAALGLVLATGAAILQLDRYFVEASLEASRRRYDMLERLRRTGGASLFRVRSRPRFTLPRFPRLGGAGPIAWRQGIELVRRAGGPVAIVAVPAAIGLGIAIAILVLAKREPPLTGIMVGVTLFVGFILNMMPMGLRADLDYLEAMKSVPIRPLAIVVGSVLFATLYVATLQTITLVAMAATLGHWYPAVPLTLAAAVPINMLSLSSDAVLVLLFPSTRRFVPEDPLVATRIMLVSLVKVAFALFSLLCAVVPLAVARLLGSEALVIPLAAGYLILLGEGLAVLLLAAWLFEHLDASSHVEEQ